MPFACITLEKQDRVATITLNRPHALNALSDVMIRELGEAIDDIEADDSLRAVIITGTGKAFCAGGDLKQLSSLEDVPHLIEFVRAFHQMANRLEACPKPSIAAINGLALGGGLELANACDLAICSEEAWLGDHHANFGLVPGGGDTQRLPRLIPPRKAKELLLTGDWLSPVEAERLGLVNKVVPADKLADEAMAMARKLADRSPLVCKSIKYLFSRGLDLPLPDGLNLEIEEVARHCSTEDFVHGVQAFVEGRKPQFPDRAPDQVTVRAR